MAMLKSFPQMMRDRGKNIQELYVKLFSKQSPGDMSEWSSSRSDSKINLLSFKEVFKVL